MTRPTALGAIVIILLLASAASAAGPTVKDFDRNNDGLIDQTELYALLLYRKNVPSRELDTNHDGRITDDEIQAAIHRQLTDVKNKLGPGPTYRVEDVVRALDGTPDTPVGQKPVPKLDLAGILVRDSYETITLGTPATSFDEAEPALFSYARNFRKDSDGWQARGAIMRPFRVFTGKPPSATATYLSAISVTPSISFDRVENSRDATVRENSLIPRLGAEAEIMTPQSFLHAHHFRLFASYATDFDFKPALGALEFDWEPVSPNVGLGLFAAIPGFKALEYRARFMLHAEWGRVWDAGDKVNLREGSFFRLGPFAEVAVRPADFPRLSVVGSVRYLVGPVGSPNHTILWKGGLSFRLDEAGHFLLKADYQKGQTPLVLDDSDTLTVGLGVKF